MVARVNHPKNEWLYNESWGVDVAVSTPRMLTALVEEAVSVGDLVRLMSFMQGEASLVEVTLADDSAARRPAIDEVTLPAGHGPRRRSCATAGSCCPRRRRPLEGGDEVLAVATTPEVEAELARVLGRRQRQPIRPGPSATNRPRATSPDPAASSDRPGAAAQRHLADH